MPRNTRNFWITVDVDGRATPIETGPRAADGGFSVSVLLREEGSISPIAVRLTGNALYDGTLVVEASVDGSPERSFKVTTTR